MKKVAYLNPQNCDSIEYDRSQVKDHKNAQIMTLDEFQAAFNGEEISDLGLIVFFDEETPEEKQEERILKAEQYICIAGDEDVSIEEQIKLIESAQAANPDKRIYLSEIEGVVEWSVTEGRLTAREFLDLIG